MAKKLSLQEILDHITDQENSEEETTEDESYNEDALQDILEEDNITEQAEDRATTEEEQSSTALCLQEQHAPEHQLFLLLSFFPIHFQWPAIFDKCDFEILNKIKILSN